MALPVTVLLAFGSRIGSIVLQAAPHSNFSAFDVELMEKPAEMVCEQRARTWGVCMGDVDLEYGNLFEIPRVNELMGRADLSLLNNSRFPPPVRPSIASQD